jgi:hypothetical protein
MMSCVDGCLAWARITAVEARETLDFWIENSVHAAEQFRTPGASQDVVSRLIEGAKVQGISEKDMQDEVGDLAAYIREKLRAANKAEEDRTDRRKRTGCLVRDLQGTITSHMRLTSNVEAVSYRARETDAGGAEGEGRRAPARCRAGTA